MTNTNYKFINTNYKYKLQFVNTNDKYKLQIQMSIPAGGGHIKPSHPLPRWPHSMSQRMPQGSKDLDQNYFRIMRLS